MLPWQSEAHWAAGWCLLKRSCHGLIWSSTCNRKQRFVLLKETTFKLPSVFVFLLQPVQFQSTYIFYQTHTAKCERIGWRSSWDIGFTWKKKCFMRSHQPWPWQPKSNQFILESNWTFEPNLKKLPRGVLQILCWQEWNVCMNGWMTPKHNIPQPLYRGLINTK